MFVIERYFLPISQFDALVALIFAASAALSSATSASGSIALVCFFVLELFDCSTSIGAAPGRLGSMRWPN